jgi:hypothetical protein
MNNQTLTFTLLFAFLVMAIFGMYLMPMHEAAGCPLMPGEAALCSTSILEHVGYWQAAFAATLTGFLMLCVGLLLLVAYTRFDPCKEMVRQRFRVHGKSPVRPTLFQELYAHGILNRRAP